MTYAGKVYKERRRQDSVWGEQNHSPECYYLILAEEVGEVAKAILELDNLETELIQVAAVIQAMWECGKRNGWF